MRFGATLEGSVYHPWRENYIDYARLKKLLREEESENQDRPWTDVEEAGFVEELLNVQLEKVNRFQQEILEHLSNKTNECEQLLHNIDHAGETLIPPDEANDGPAGQTKEILVDLDEISQEVHELEIFSRINYTGFLKAAKKHDRRRGAKYKVRPLLQVRLAALPSHYEECVQLLHRVSSVSTFGKRLVPGLDNDRKTWSNISTQEEKYTSYKFWVHLDNLSEVKTYILRRLPVLVYNPQSSKVAEGHGRDPVINSLYFDNNDFALYHEKVAKVPHATSLRLRWYGQLFDKPEIFFEKKTVRENGDSEDIRIPIKEKWIIPFLSGEYKMEKEIEKLRGLETVEPNGRAKLQRSVEDIQHLIKVYKLRPMLRANYLRTAYQIPGDDKVRISVDTELSFIREDSLSDDQPCRHEHEWHRHDIDRMGLQYPFKEIRQSEVTRFPHAILEIKLRKAPSKKTAEWVQELMSSHLLKEIPGFSKFVHGTADLFEDYVNAFPFWLNDLETNILKDPHDAFHQEQARKGNGNLDRGIKSVVGQSNTTESRLSPVNSTVHTPSSETCRLLTAEAQKAVLQRPEKVQGEDDPKISKSMIGKVLSIPAFSNSKYARSRPSRRVHLPDGVQEPQRWLKDANPIRVEPKVWLANERTFVKWQHVSILLASLSLGLYNAAGDNDAIARLLAVAYTLVAIYAAVWGWRIYIRRAYLIEARSGKDIDNILGPILICLCLIVALLLNFALKYQTALTESSSKIRTRKSTPAVTDIELSNVEERKVYSDKVL